MCLPFCLKGLIGGAGTLSTSHTSLNHFLSSFLLNPTKFSSVLYSEPSVFRYFRIDCIFAGQVAA
jgi:hypothetical protein